MPCWGTTGAFMRIFLFLLVLAASPKAFAGLTPQGLVKVTGSTTLGNGIDLGFFGSAFLVPGADPLAFSYLGPGFQVTEGWWVSPRVGVTMNWPTSGGAAPIVSLWNSITFPNARLSLFAETEVYVLASGDVDYYGWYEMDYNRKRLSVGVHGEQVNVHLTVGPHVYFDIAPHLTIGLEHHLDVADVTSNALRVVVKLDFK